MMEIRPGIQATEVDQDRFRKDTDSRQLEDIKSLTYKSDGRIQNALAALERRYPDDDTRATKERIICFLKHLQ